MSILEAVSTVQRYFNIDEQVIFDILSPVTNAGLQDCTVLDQQVEKFVVLAKERMDASESNPIYACHNLYGIFKKVLDSRSKLLPQKREYLDAACRNGLVEAVKPKWTSLMAATFLPIPSISEDTALADAAAKWAGEFFQGVNYFCQLKNELLFSSIVEKVLNRTKNAYFEKSKTRHSQLQQVVIHQNNNIELVADLVCARIAEMSADHELMGAICWREYSAQMLVLNAEGRKNLFSELNKNIIR